MSLTPGTLLGPYEIIAPIGEGGMGEVYKARDTRLDRIVALKLSKNAFSGRFALEARAVASLNHSNICTLHDVGPNYLVMEFIEGAPLSGPMPIDQALRYAIQICSALDAAHRKNITHRDLKPENILVTKSGVKLLDFGLAKISHRHEMQEGISVAETLTGRHEIIGTLCYMSPEQLRGKAVSQEVDSRSDIFSFGLVLYELLTGKRLFDGPSPADVIAAIVERPAPSIASFAPPALDRLLQRCLNKDPDDRWQTARDLKAELEWIANTPPPHADDAPRRRSYWPWIAGAAACLLALILAAAMSRSSAPFPTGPYPVARALITLPGGSFVNPVVSRDGTRLLYGQIGIPSRLWIRMIDQLEGHQVPGSEGGESGTFSPDGHWIAFLKGPLPYKLAKIPVTGGSPTILSSEADFITTPYWADDGSILAGSAQGLVRVPAAGGRVETLTAVDHTKNEIGHFEPVPLPGGRGVVFTVGSGPSMDTARDTARVAVLDLKSHVYQLLQNAGSTPSYVPTGHIVYRRGSTMFALPFDLGSLKATGGEAAVLEGLTSGLAAGAAPYSFSPAGLLVYRVGNEARESTALSWLDRKGGAQPLPERPHPWQNAPLSADGRKVAGELIDDTTGNERIWIYNVDRGVLTQLTSIGRDYDPVWTPDGRVITFGSNQKGHFGIYRMPADSSRQAALLLATQSLPYPSSWTPDGKTLVFHEFEQSTAQIYLLPVLADGKVGPPRRFHPDENSSELQAVVSPDGKWLAYTSDHSGRFEIYVSPFPDSGAKFQISTQGGRLPKWSRNGRELFYVELNPRRLMAAEIPPGAAFQPGPPRPLFVIRNDGGPVYYDVAPDGNHFLALMPPQGASTAPALTTFVTVTNWFEELSRRAPLKK